MRAFVTGATGFIGRRLVSRLLKEGDAVTALVRDPGASMPPNVRVVRETVSGEAELLRSAMRGCDVVYHLAARISFDPNELPDLLRVNADGTRNIFDSARSASVPRTVLVSSACTVGLSQRADQLLDESSKCEPQLHRRNPYLASKSAAEGYAFQAAKTGQDVVIVNPTTVFGPGDHSLNSGTIVHQVAGSLVMPIPPGGSNVVDVDDVVDGILAVGSRGRSGRRYILGGHNLRYKQIVEQIANVIGRRPVLLPLPPIARYPMSAAAWLVHRITHSRLITPQIIADTFSFKFFSSRRAESECGWRAQRDFADTLTAAWDYYQREGLIAAKRKSIEGSRLQIEGQGNPAR